MKRVKKPIFWLIVLLIFALSYVSFFGIHGLNGDIPVTYIKGVQEIRWGIDIKGGVEATFIPANGIEATNEQIDSTKAIIESRLVKNNITDYELYADYSNDKIIVRLPWKEYKTDFNPEKAIEELSAKAALTFREGKEYESTDFDSDNNTVYKTPSGITAENVLIEGKDIANAQAITSSDQMSNKIEYSVQLNFTEEGKEKFAEATSRLVGQTISIWMDDIMISSPTVNTSITDGVASITGDFTADEASSLAAKINSGTLPFALETDNLGSISSTIGSTSLTAIGITAVIALALICLFVLLRYRLPGFITCIALIGQIDLLIAAFSGFFLFIPSFTITLPGIAGIILSIVMGIDANIITAEKIKEELYKGKSIDGAINKGTKSSFSAVFNGNITVIIVAIILIGIFGPYNIFGPSITGAIYSFGYTLLVGVISNFIMGIGASRLMLKSISKFKIFRKKWLYGGVKNENI